MVLSESMKNIRRKRTLWGSNSGLMDWTQTSKAVRLGWLAASVLAVAIEC
jgi:hypothetical protein